MKKTRGSVMLLVLVFAGIFLAVLGALAGSVLVNSRAQTFSYQQAEARAIAEAGLNQYKWHLEQSPTDTAEPDPSTTTYTDLEGRVVGTYTLSIVPDTACPGSGAYTLRSLGAPSDAPSVQATIAMLYVPPEATFMLPPDCTPLATSSLPQFLNWHQE